MTRKYIERNVVVYQTVSTHELKGLKGTQIFAEKRANHMWKEAISEGVEQEHDYLIFLIPAKGKHNQLYHEVRRLGGVNVTFLDDYTEIASHRPQVFHNTLLSHLVKHGFVKHTWKESEPEEAGSYPLYINASGFQVIYNMGSLGLGAMHKFWRQKVLKRTCTK